jgi:Domain of unknown function (DUF4349)
MNKRAIAAILTIPVIAAVLAACGGSTDREQTVSSGVAAPANDRTGSMGELVEGAPAADASTSGSPGLAPSEQTFDRKIVQDTTLDLQVEDVARSYQDAMRVALDAGGYVLDSSVSPAQDKPEADLSVRVPNSSYEDVLGKMRGLAVKVENETSKAQDVTDQYTDLQARLRSAQAVEARYLDLLNRAETIDDVLKVQDRLAPVRLQIEQIQGQMNVLDNLSSLATITVHLSTQPVEVAASDSGPDPLAAAAAGWKSSLLFLRAVGAGVFATGAFLWWLAPILVIVGVGFLVRYRMTRKSGSTS